MTVGLGIIILQGVFRRKYLAGVNIMSRGEDAKGHIGIFRSRRSLFVRCPSIQVV
jgi:hypothetical protein